ncbi:hypothetical protein DV737_g2397, partial [Chaetothyriales sp. CBS 132003]
MGNESSSPVDESVPPLTLRARNLDAVAKYVKEHDVKNIVVMVGAGISTSAGIPDFRSPDTGLYANLARLNLPYAEAVFDIGYFRRNPLPFYTLAHELYPGKYHPTVTHSFISLLHQKGRLLKLFTQNIDCLEREAGVPADKIVEAHGSFATQRCIECRTEYPDASMREKVAKMEIPRCIQKTCNGLVKPDIVFFGEALPESFHRNRNLPVAADLVIIMGTSLQVQPFASLPSFANIDTPRLLINKEQVGGLGSRPDDVLFLGDCDEGVRKFADALGWREDLEAEFAKTRPKVADKKAEPGPELAKSKQQQLEEEIEKLTKGIDKTLRVNAETTKRLEEELRPSKGPNPEDVLEVPKKEDTGEDRLRKTAFFHRHGEAGAHVLTKRERSGTTALAALDSAIPSKAESKATVKSEDDAANRCVMQPDCTGDAHYELPCNTDQDFWAFKIFADWIYSEQPRRLKTRPDVKVALKAYMLALAYEAYSLQNALVDRFREYHREHVIDFRDLTFLIDRVEGIKSGCMKSAPLTSYMIEQVAHEICVNGYDKFEQDNWSFQNFINDGDRRHRSDLVRAISCFACKSRSMADVPQSLIEEIATLERLFTVDGAKLKQITDHFVDELQKGLDGDNANIPMNPTWVIGFPTGHEQGVFLALDMGGTNLRVCEITLPEEKGEFDIIQSKYRLPEELKTAAADELWEYVADCLEQFIHFHHKDGEVHGKIPLGFTFSYPATQDYIDHGILQRWTKGFDIAGVEGHDVVPQFEAALKSRGLPVTLAALINDTTGTLIASAYTDPAMRIGCIFGTGCNAAYMENCGSINKLKHLNLDPDMPMAINCEYGAFDNDHVVLPLTKYDTIIDETSPRPGQQAFEKMIAGLYLGEIFRLVLVDLHENKGLLFANQDISALRKPYTLDASFLSFIEEDPFENLQETHDMFADRLKLEASKPELELCRRLAELIGTRAARLSACGVAAICKKKKYEACHVGADGSVFNKYPHFKQRGAQALREILDWPKGKRDPVVLSSAEDGSGVGAALIAALTIERMRAGNTIGIKNLANFDSFLTESSRAGFK